MPERIYEGSHAAVEIVVDGELTMVARGGSVTVGDEQAKEMDVSSAWGKPRRNSKEKE